MARQYDFTAVVAPGSNVTKGLIYLTAGSTYDFKVVELEVTMDGGSTQYWPEFRWIQGTSGFTAPTGGTSLTINKAGGESYNLAANTTGKFGTFTAELAAGSGSLITRRGTYLLNQAGELPQWPLGREPLYCPPSNCLYLEAITPTGFANNIRINGVIEE